MSDRHIVWDWNGTLLDDLPFVVEAVNAGLALLGGPVIDVDGYRSHYTRPVKVFYDRLLQRELPVEEWLEVNTVFHDVYFELLGEGKLTADADQAMDLATSLGATQSLLSMAPHDHLVGLVTRLGLGHRFVHVRGSDGEPGGLKASALELHLDSLGIDGSSVTLIGDTPDDGAAAAHVGGLAVLYDGGSHHRDDLEAEGWPVASTLVEAVRLAIPGPAPTPPRR